MYRLAASFTTSQPLTLTRISATHARTLHSSMSLNKLKTILNNTVSTNNNKPLTRTSKQYASAALVATAATALYAVYVNNTTATAHSYSTAAQHNTTAPLLPIAGPTDVELEHMSNVISNKPIDAVTGVAVDTGIRILNESTISSILSRHTQSVPINRGHVESVEVSWYQANHPRIEDTFSIVPAMAVANGMLIGVFDGHSGNAASAFCRNELLQYVQEYKRSNLTSTLIDKVPFVHADADFLDYCWLDHAYESGLSGACAVTVHIDNDTVSTANIGDCRAVIARRNSNTAQPSYTAVELTTDHQIDTNEAEKLRLLSEHPNERDVISRNRVKGRLQPTRGMGDGIYKRDQYYDYKCAQLGKSLSTYGWTAPYTTAEPTITHHRFDASDDYLIISTDGLFQDLSSQQVAAYVGEYLQTHKQQSSGLSSYLIRKALLHAANRLPHAYRTDEATALSSLLQLPVGFRRNLHDDITIIVCKLRHDGTLPPDTAIADVKQQATPTLQRALHDPERLQRIRAYEDRVQQLKSKAKLPSAL